MHNNNDTLELSPRLTQILLFSIGFVAVSMQFIYMRQVAPFVGSSTIVSSIVVSMFLGALALGVSKGGNVETLQIPKLRRNLLISSIILAIGPSYFVVNEFFSVYFSVTSSIPGLGFLDNPLVALTVYLSIFMFPLIYLIEQSVPLLMNFMKESRAAKQAGDAFNKSTWGNVIGGVFTTVILMYYLGMAWSIAVNSIVLCLISLALTTTPLQRKAGLMFLGGLSVITYTLNIYYEELFFVKTTAYNNYQVVDLEDDSVAFMLNKNYSSLIFPDGSGAPYIQHIRRVLFNLPEEHQGKDYLIVGAGGFSLTRQGLGGNNVTFVDIDPQIKTVAEEHFLKEGIKGKFIPEDARTLLSKNKQKWDAVVVDAYTGMNSIPKTLITKQFFELVKSNMNFGGKAVFNMIIDSTFDSKFSKGIDNTIRSVFKSCQSRSMDKHHGIDNVVYICSVNEHEDYDVIYTDNDTKHEFDAQSQMVETIKKKNKIH